MTEDELATAEEKIQKITDKFVAKIDTMIIAKEKEVMEV